MMSYERREFVPRRFVLGPLMEENLRRAMQVSRGDPSIFVTRPSSAGLLPFALVLLALIIVPPLRRTREIAVQEEN